MLSRVQGIIRARIDELIQHRSLSDIAHLIQSRFPSEFTELISDIPATTQEEIVRAASTYTLGRLLEDRDLFKEVVIEIIGSARFQEELEIILSEKKEPEGLFRLTMIVKERLKAILDQMADDERFGRESVLEEFDTILESPEQWFATYTEESLQRIGWAVAQLTPIERECMRARLFTWSAPEDYYAFLDLIWDLREKLSKPIISSEDQGEFPPSPEIIVALLTHDRVQDAITLIHELLEQEYSNFHLIVLDNGSSESAFQKLHGFLKTLELANRPAGPQSIILLRSNDNLFASGGRSVLLRHAKENHTVDYALMLEDDIRLCGDRFINKLVDRMLIELKNCKRKNQLSPGVVVPKMYCMESKLIWSLGENRPGKAFSLSNMIGSNEFDEGQYDELLKQPIQNPLTTAMLVSMCMVKNIGLFDSRFKNCHEDREWTDRARNIYSYYIEAKAFINHIMRDRATTEERNLFRERFKYLEIRNIFLWYNSAPAAIRKQILLRFADELSNIAKDWNIQKGIIRGIHGISPIPVSNPVGTEALKIER